MATLEPLYGEDLVLLMLGAPTGEPTAQNRINGITRLEKLLFLADKEAHIQNGVEEPLQFVAYHYGPYSKKVYEAVDLLEAAGLVREERALDDRTIDDAEEIESDVTDETPIERRFFLTDDGEAVAALLLQAHPSTASALTSVKDRYASMSLSQLIRYVYARYEAYTVNSRIKDKVG